MNNPSKRPARPARHAVVTRTERLHRDLVRVHLTGPDLLALPELMFTDHYVKLLFPPAGAPYVAPFDPEQVATEVAPEFQPVMRTYTIRSFDREANDLVIDFVVHGDEGIAGPWAAGAQPGDAVVFRGPGGAWAPDAAADGHVYIGDESAAPAIAAGLERTPRDVPTRVYLEVADAGVHVPLPTWPGLDVHWVHSSDHGGEHGVGLVSAVLADVSVDANGRQSWNGMQGDLSWFVHGNADMIRQVRRLLRHDLGVEPSRVSISGYWRPGQNEDAWQATKRDFVAAMEKDA